MRTRDEIREQIDKFMEDLDTLEGNTKREILMTKIDTLLWVMER